MGKNYTTLERRTIALGGFTTQERRFLGELTRRLKNTVSYLDFENLYLEPDSQIFKQSKRLCRPVEETPLYQVCDDLGKRLGIRQGFLVREEVVERYAAGNAETKEFTTGEVARLAGCTDEAVRKAIRTGRLRARRVGRFSLIREEDATAFVNVRKKEGGRSP